MYKYLRHLAVLFLGGVNSVVAAGNVAPVEDPRREHLVDDQAPDNLAAFFTNSLLTAYKRPAPCRQTGHAPLRNSSGSSEPENCPAGTKYRKYPVFDPPIIELAPTF